MTGVVQSPKKGKENKNVSNHIPVPKKNAPGERTPKKEGSRPVQAGKKAAPDKKLDRVEEVAAKGPADSRDEEDSSSSTSNRSVRPQTKILRRPTPNLKHPVIQVDYSDDSSGDSGKDDNPKRQKMGSDSGNSHSSDHGKRKNFIMYNKHNVDKNTKNNNSSSNSNGSVKDRTSALPASIPNPCNSCSRSQAPERLHSHARRDSRGLMLRRSPADVKMTSPQKKQPLDSVRVAKVKEVKSSPSSPSCSKGIAAEDKQGPASASSSPRRVPPPLPPPKAKGPAASGPLVDNCGEDEPKVPVKDFEEPSKACYICQKEFKASSLFLHESKCLETWKKTNNALTPNLRQLPPRRPQEESNAPTDEEEDDPAWSAVQSQLVPCPLCGRTFFPERLPVHRRVCKGKQSPRPLKRASSLRESPSSVDGEDAKPPPMYMPCYVCSRNYGSWVLPMHEQQCLKKWRKENEKLADEERREEPQKVDSSAEDDIASIAELGDNAWESHLQQLVPCPRCSRTFFPDRLQIHERSCKGPSCNRRPRSNKGI